MKSIWLLLAAIFFITYFYRTGGDGPPDPLLFCAYVRLQLNPIHAWVILSDTLTITLEWFLCLCEAVIESYSCMGDSVSHSNHYTRMFLCLCEAVIESYSCMGDSVSHTKHYTRMFLCLCEAAIQSYSCMGDSVSCSNHYTRMFPLLV